MVFWESLIVLGLILLNGLFAMAELALISVRKARLKALADRGNRRAGAALALAAEPGQFLSTVQIGITLIGILAGVFGGATLAAALRAPLEALSWTAPVADTLAYGIVVVVITFLSLVLGELVPKQIALRRAERIALTLAPPMRTVARLVSPITIVLDGASRLVLAALGQQAAPGHTVSDDEIKALIAEATRAGVVEEAEQEMISGVMRLADRPVRAIMTPRPEVKWLDAAEPADEIRRKLAENAYSHFPVCRGHIDEVLGVVHVRDILNALLAGRPIDLGPLVRPAPVVPDSTDALDALDALRPAETPMALVVDEYGSLEGVVTRADILETIVGELSGAGAEAGIVRRPDGSWLIDGGTPIDEVSAALELATLAEAGDFHTIAGFILSRLQHLPKAGEAVAWRGYRFEVVDMDGRRIDKVLVSRLPGAWLDVET
jgi:putative hemolysin